MAVTDGKIQLENANLDTFEVTMPDFGYQSIIRLPFDIVKLEKSYKAYDNGAGSDDYDKRECRCSIVMDSTEAAALNDFLRSGGVTKGRAQNLTLRMDTGSGFFPFGPDKGDVGDFTGISVLFINPPSQISNPVNYFEARLIFNAKASSYPVYALPSQVKDGELQIGTIIENRFPPDFFSPEENVGYVGTVLQDGETEYIDRGEEAQDYETHLNMLSNESKAAAVINYLTATARAGSFSLVTPTGFYPFGRNLGDGTFTVNLISNVITITHNRYNEFAYPLSLGYLSGPS